MPFKNIYSILNECKYGIFTHIHYIDRIRTHEWTLCWCCCCCYCSFVIYSIFTYFKIIMNRNSRIRFEYNCNLYLYAIVHFDSLWKSPEARLHLSSKQSWRSEEKYLISPVLHSCLEQILNFYKILENSFTFSFH